MANAGSGKVPEYTASDVSTFLARMASGIGDVTEVTLYVVAVVGLLIFCTGLYQVAKESREAAFGGGGSRRYGFWFVGTGAALGAVGTISILLISLARPPA